MALMARGRRRGVVTETIFENRFMHVPELRGMGADIHVDGHTAMVHGVPTALGRAGDGHRPARLGLAGPGRAGGRGGDRVRRVYHLDRGYEAAGGEARGVRCGHRTSEQVRLPAAPPLVYFPPAC